MRKYIPECYAPSHVVALMSSWRYVHHWRTFMYSFTRSYMEAFQWFLFPREKFHFEIENHIHNHNPPHPTHIATHLSSCDSALNTIMIQSSLNKCTRKQLHHQWWKKIDLRSIYVSITVDICSSMKCEAITVYFSSAHI